MTIAGRTTPFASVVKLADHPRAHIVTPVVELFLELVFEDLAFFFHHQNLFQTLCKFVHALRFQRPGHTDLVEPQSDIAGDLFIDAKVVKGLAGIEIGLAGSDDADACMGAVPDDLVELVDACIRQCRIPLVDVHARFLLQHGIGLADIEATRR